MKTGVANMVLALASAITDVAMVHSVVIL